MNDIDLSSYANWDPIGEMDPDAGIMQGFTGVLDGNGYSIKNLTINRPDEEYVGLFAITGGEVQNLGLENIDVTGDIIVGALAGVGSNVSNCSVSGSITCNTAGGLLFGMGGGNIESCYTSGDITGLNGKNYYCGVGGLVGWANTANILECYSNSTIKTNSTNDMCSGGLIGRADNSIVANCYTIGEISAGNGVGGIVGMLAKSSITNSFTTMKSSGLTYVSGLAGVIDKDSSLTNSIWNTETTGQSTAVDDNQGGTESNNKGLTTSEMQDPSNWSGWDTDIWDFSTYPPTFKMYTPVGGGSTGGGDVQIPGAVRLQIGSDSSSTSAIYVDTSFDLGAFDVDFSSADSCAAAIEDIDEVLSRINTKRSEFGAVINRLSSILESQTTTIQNFTSAKSTIMDADIANESADFVKNQILQQTSSALLAQSQNLHASIVLSLIG